MAVVVEHSKWLFINTAMLLPTRRKGTEMLIINCLTLHGTLKVQSNGLLYINTVISTLAVDGRAVIFGTARRGLGGLRPRPVPSSLYQM